MDIGFGAISGAFERDHDFTYVCVDNETYMKTGVQSSSGTPYDASTTTAPAGKFSFGNPFPKEYAYHHGSSHVSPYVVTNSLGFLRDMVRKVKKATDIVGSTYIHAYSLCTTGWGFDTSKTLKIAKLAVETCLWPMYEIENGEITQVRKVKDVRPVEEYLRTQKSFKHLFTMEGGDEEIKRFRPWRIGT